MAFIKFMAITEFDGGERVEFFERIECETGKILDKLIDK